MLEKMNTEQLNTSVACCLAVIDTSASKQACRYSSLYYCYALAKIYTAEVPKRASKLYIRNQELSRHIFTI